MLCDVFKTYICSSTKVLKIGSWFILDRTVIDKQATNSVALARLVKIFFKHCYLNAMAY